MTWTWERATPKERADWVRRHLWWFGLPDYEVKKLFRLTIAGMRLIEAGASWTPAYQEN